MSEFFRIWAEMLCDPMFWVFASPVIGMVLLTIVMSWGHQCPV